MHVYPTCLSKTHKHVVFTQRLLTHIVISVDKGLFNTKYICGRAGQGTAGPGASDVCIYIYIYMYMYIYIYICVYIVLLLVVVVVVVVFGSILIIIVMISIGIVLSSLDGGGGKQVYPLLFGVFGLGALGCLGF